MATQSASIPTVPRWRRIRRLVPRWAKEAVEQVASDWRVAAALATPKRNGCFSDRDQQALFDAWGNKAFSAKRSYLRETIRLAEQYEGDVLECGTGATTLAMAVLGEAHGFYTHALEQSRYWSAVMARTVRKNELSAVRLHEAPLTRRSDYLWYELGEAVLPHHFGLVICDGPYVSPETPEPLFTSWRYGVLEYLRDNGSTFEMLIVDDAGEDRARVVLDRWRSRFNACIVLTHKPDCAYATVTLPR